MNHFLCQLPDNRLWGDRRGRWVGVATSTESSLAPSTMLRTVPLPRDFVAGEDADCGISLFGGLGDAGGG